MSTVHVCRKHNLDEGECQSLAQELLQKLVDHFGGNYRADGSNYRYRHATGVSAYVQPKSEELLVDVKLGLMTRSLASAIEEKMNEVLDEYLD